MLQFLSTLSLIASMLYLYVGIYTYKLDKNSAICKMFLLINSAMFIWSFAYSFAYTAESALSFSFWNKVSAFGWCTFSALILYLVLVITKSKVLNYLIIKILILLPAFVFLFITLFLFGPSIKTNKSIEFFFYKGNFIYNFSYLLLSIVLIYLWGKNSANAIQKQQSKIIVITSLTPFILNLVTQSILPFCGIHVIPNMGQIYSLMMLWGIYYAIVNYHFMQIPASLITKELFSQMVNLTLLVDLKGNIMRTNKQVYDLLDYTEAELRNIPITVLIKKMNLETLLMACGSLTEVVRFNDVSITSKTGNTIPFNLSLTPLRDSKTHMLLGMMIVGQDMRSIKSLINEITQHKLTSEKLKQSAAELERVNNELLATNKQLKEKSIRDGLTNLYNHQHINDFLEIEIKRSILSKSPLCLMMLDIDFFKRVNDNFGHQVGDKVLVTVSRLIESSVRNIDLTGRYGGEEFIIILPHIDLKAAYVIADKIRLSIQNFDFGIDNLNVTISIGLTQSQAESPKLLVNRADTLLYQAKHNGRNRIEV